MDPWKASLENFNSISCDTGGAFSSKWHPPQLQFPGNPLSTDLLLGRTQNGSTLAVIPTWATWVPWEISSPSLPLHTPDGQAASAVSASLHWPSEQLASPPLPFRFSRQGSDAGLWCLPNSGVAHQAHQSELQGITKWSPETLLPWPVVKGKQPSPNPWEEREPQQGHTSSFAQISWSLSSTHILEMWV